MFDVAVKKCFVWREKFPRTEEYCNRGTAYQQYVSVFSFVYVFIHLLLSHNKSMYVDMSM